jgi:DNA-binding IclR family transcriptional regulator
MTLRDEVWDTVLMQLKNRGRFKISELRFSEGERHTVRRVLREMEEMDWVMRESEHAAIWRLGPKAEMMLELSPDIVEASRT